MTLTPTVRVHQAIARYPWARFWYYCRLMDKDGSGFIVLNRGYTLRELGCKKSALYCWLKSAKECGAIRSYCSRHGLIYIFLGSLTNLCQRLKILDWGWTSEITRDQLINHYRPTVTAIAVSDLQEKSRFEAIREMDKETRKIYRVPTSSDCLSAKNKPLFSSMASPPKTRGKKEVFGILGTTENKIWVSAKFIPFGASQAGVADCLGISDRTVRRHLKALDIKGKQIVQASSVYKGCYEEASILGDARIEESSGFSHVVGADRFFKAFGKTWLRRCNLYDLSFPRYTLREKRKQYYGVYGIDLNPKGDDFLRFAAPYLKPGKRRKSKKDVYRLFKNACIQSAIDKFSLSEKRNGSRIGSTYMARVTKSVLSISENISSSSIPAREGSVLTPPGREPGRIN